MTWGESSSIRPSAATLEHVRGVPASESEQLASGSGSGSFGAVESVQSVPVVDLTDGSTTNSQDQFTEGEGYDPSKGHPCSYIAQPEKGKRTRTSNRERVEAKERTQFRRVGWCPGYWDELRYDIEYYARHYRDDTRGQMILLGYYDSDGTTRACMIPYTSRLHGYERTKSLRRIRKKLLRALGRCTFMTLSTDMARHNSYFEAWQNLIHSFQKFIKLLRTDGRYRPKLLHGGYVAALEVGSVSGVIHLHVFLVDCGYINKVWMDYLFNTKYNHCQITDIEEIKNRSKASNYVMKYLEKNLIVEEGFHLGNDTVLMAWAMNARQVTTSRDFAVKRPGPRGWWFIRKTTLHDVGRHAESCDYCRNHIDAYEDEDPPDPNFNWRPPEVVP